MEPDDALAPAFKPGDYLDDAELERLLPKLGVEAGLVPGDFVDERHLDIVVGLVSQASRRDADKAEEWRLVAKEQGKIFIDLGSDDELNMDCVDVRYHWGGRYVTSDGVMQYTGGRAATSSIEVDKLSLPELKGHVGDHIPAAKEHSLSKELVLRWKPRGTGFADLTILHDDKGVQGMLSSYGPGHTVDVYVQLPKSIQHLANGSQKQNPGFPDGGREKKNQEKQKLHVDPRPLPDEVDSKIDDLLKLHLNTQIYSNFQMLCSLLLSLDFVFLLSTYLDPEAGSPRWTVQIHIC
ncbi:hypothetical protein ACQ4PT_035220 [Festuca glaucescens]